MKAPAPNPGSTAWRQRTRVNPHSRSQAITCSTAWKWAGADQGADRVDHADQDRPTRLEDAVGLPQRPRQHTDRQHHQMATGPHRGREGMERDQKREQHASSCGLTAR